MQNPDLEVVEQQEIGSTLAVYLLVEVVVAVAGKKRQQPTQQTWSELVVVAS